MTRRITKDDLLEIVPAIPATPYVPGYERVLRTWPGGPGPSMSGEIREYIGDWDGGAIRGRYNGDVIEAYEIVPATPAKPGVPGYTIDRGVAAWNAGGSSISLLAGDGAFEFYTNNAPGGVVCGLVTADVSTLPHEATHAIKVVGSRAYVVERGVVVHAFPTTVSAATRYFIRRTGTTVYFLSGADAYTSATPITTAKVYLDAALYLSGDYVDSPDLVEGDSGATTGEIAATLSAVVGKAGEPRSVVAGVLPALAGDVYSAISGAAAYVYGLIPPMGGLITGLTGAQGEAEGTFGAVVGVVADYDYSFVSGTFSPLTGEASWVDENDFRIASSTMSLSSDATNMQRVGDSVVSTLNMVDAINGVLFISDAIYDALMLSDALYSHQSAVDAIGAMLQLGTGLVQSAETDLSPQDVAARAPTQYAVNVVTGALTTYTGYDFLRYATVDQTTFGAKADGVYRIRPGDDDGSTRPVYIDFGTLLLDSPVVKTVEAVNLAVDSDGQMFVRLVTGDSDRLYRVVHRDEISRAVASRGVGGRSWNVSLEVEDSTDFVLDMVELSVATGSRRWASRR